MKENRNTPLKESTPADTGGTSTDGASLFSMGKGYIKIHRALIDWEWYQDEHLKSVFLHLLLRCNWQDKKWMGRTVKAGTLICSTATLSEELGLSRSSIVRALARLKSSGEISIEADNKWTAITLVNWAKYQGDTVEAEQPADSQRTAGDTTSGQRVTQRADTTKEGKEGKKGRKEEVESAQAHRPIDPIEAFKAKCGEIVQADPERLPKAMRAAFLAYWTEPSKSGKLRFECEKFFDVGRRMDTWRRNEEKRSERFTPNTPSPTAKPWVS